MDSSFFLCRGFVPLKGIVFYDVFTTLGHLLPRPARPMGMATLNHSLLRRSFAGLMAFAFVAFAFSTATSEDSSAPKPNRNVFAENSNVPEPVRKVLERACMDCHSANTLWPWYSNIPPVSWQIHNDVAKPRAFMDLSKWNEYTENQRRGFTLAIEAATEGHLMPPPRYLWMHPGARLSSDELATVKAWAFGRLNSTNSARPQTAHKSALPGTP